MNEYKNDKKLVSDSIIYSQHFCHLTLLSIFVQSLYSKHVEEFDCQMFLYVIYKDQDAIYVLENYGRSF